jgi:hypothetical protein
MVAALKNCDGAPSRRSPVSDFYADLTRGAEDDIRRKKASDDALIEEYDAHPCDGSGISLVPAV